MYVSISPIHVQNYIEKYNTEQKRRTLPTKEAEKTSKKNSGNHLKH